MVNRDPRWPMFRRVWRRAELTNRMIEALNVDPIIAARIDTGDAYRDACATCLTCPAAPACRRWLNEPEYTSKPPDFCPNARFFGTCLLNQRKCVD